MEVISIDGIEYVRAAAIARKYKYTSDYIGQLCRSGKVAAKLVGRTWYVNPDSIDAHKGGRYQKSSSDEKTKNNNSNTKSSRINVEAVPRAETAKTIANVRQRNPQYLRRIEWKPVKYEADQSDLLPPLRQEAVPVKVPVDVAEAETLTITESSKPVNLEAEPLPEVALRGAIKIRNAEDDFSYEENSEENIDISFNDVEDDAVHIHPKSKDKKATVKIETNEGRTLDEISVKEERGKENDDRYTYEVPVTVTDQASFTPKSVSKRVVNHDLEVGKTEPKQSCRAETIIVTMLVAGALLGGGLMFSLEKVTTATAVGQSSTWEVSSPFSALK